MHLACGIRSALQIWLLYCNSRRCMKVDLRDGPAPEPWCTFFQKSLLSGIGVDDAFSFVPSLGGSLATAACWAAASGAFVLCLVCGSWEEGTFLSGLTEVTGCWSVLWKETKISGCWKPTKDKITCSTLRHRRWTCSRHHSTGHTTQQGAAHELHCSVLLN